MMEKANRTPKGLTWNVFNRPEDLKYADDIACSLLLPATYNTSWIDFVYYVRQVGLIGENEATLYKRACGMLPAD